MYKQIKELPPLNKPSQLIRVALEDLEKQEKLPNKNIFMGDWHHWDDETNKCNICLAGAVMCERFNVLDTQDVSYENFEDDSSRQFRALNSFRRGEVEDAFDNLGIKNTFDIPNKDIAYYPNSPTQFKKDLLELADELESHGL